MVHYFINYIIESSISLTLLALFYYLLLRKETFFIYNRVFLMGSLLFSLILPLLHVQLSTPNTITTLPEVVVVPEGITWLQEIVAYTDTFSSVATSTISSHSILLVIYGIGVLLFLSRFVYKLWQIRQMKRKSLSQNHQKGVTIYTTPKQSAPFSFLNGVFLPEDLGVEEGYEQILTHELMHVSKGHSYDILIIELFFIIQWFNPAIWLLKRALHENHEYAVDSAILSTGITRGNYKLLLLSQYVGCKIDISNYFNYSLIKNRIKMMSKIKSNKTHNFKYILGLVLALGLVFFFGVENEAFAETTAITQKEAQEEQIFTVVEQQAEYPGGMKALLKKISKSITYPEEASKKGIQGRVFLKFIIDKDGNAKSPVILRGVDSLLDAEAIRVIKTLDKFKPAMQRGKAVSVWYQLPITFKLGANDTTETTATNTLDEEQIFTIAEETPEYPGGIKALLGKISESITYPEEAVKKNIQGRVFLRFIVDKEGNAKSPVILRGVDPLLDAEAIRVVKTLDKFKPAMQRGKAVSAWYQLPITFNLGETKKEEK